MSQSFMEYSGNAYEQSLTGVPGWLKPIKEQAWREFSKQGLPIYRKDEAWKYTNLAVLNKCEWTDANEHTELGLGRLSLLPLKDAYRIVFHGDSFCEPLSDLPKEVQIDVISNSDSDKAEAFFGRTDQGLGLLNTALSRDGLIIELAQEQKIDKPFYFIFVVKPGVCSPRVIVKAGARSHAVFYEHVLGECETGSMLNLVSQFDIGEAASIERVKVVEEGVFVFEHLVANLEKAAHFKSQFFGLGSRLSRDDVSVHLNGEGASCVLNGLFMAKGQDQIDSRTLIDHAASNCQSKEVYRGVLDGRSTGVFDGRVLVREHAQKTLSEQSNKNLLLSEDALINTKPQLEIYADDVKCAHGATSGQLDENALFYLRSRGLDHSEAKSILTYAFAAELMADISDPQLKDYLREQVMNWLGEDFGK